MAALLSLFASVALGALSGEYCDHDNFKDFIHNRKESEALLIRDDGIGCFLYGLELRQASLPGAVFLGAELSSATLSGNFQGADFRWAWLENANVAGADFRNARFEGAKLFGANLSEAVSLRGARYDKWTKFPKGFSPDEAGMVMDPLGTVVRRTLVLP